MRNYKTLSEKQDTQSEQRSHTGLIAPSCLRGSRIPIPTFAFLNSSSLITLIKNKGVRILLSSLTRTG